MTHRLTCGTNEQAAPHGSHGLLDVWEGNEILRSLGSLGSLGSLSSLILDNSASWESFIIYHISCVQSVDTVWGYGLRKCKPTGFMASSPEVNELCNTCVYYYISGWQRITHTFCGTILFSWVIWQSILGNRKFDGKVCAVLLTLNGKIKVTRFWSPPPSDLLTLPPPLSAPPFLCHPLFNRITSSKLFLFLLLP